jgi:hypothetical protein
MAPNVNDTSRVPRRILRAACQRFTALVALAALAAFVACARTGLDPSELEGDSARGGSGAVWEIDAGVEPTRPVPTATSAPHSGEPPSVCEPAPEICNLRDDDCNGRIDDLPPVPCPAGGFRYCVAGKESACPTPCESCVPGSERICFVSYCTFWGVQTCAADGRGFGPCREEHAPPPCSRYSRDRDDRKQLEQCCVEQGYCCLDVEDLDKDGDRREMLGRCDEVVCR